MVVKKVVNPNKSASKAVRIQALAQYIHTPQTENETEKCLYWRARGFLSDTLNGQIAEMRALAQDAVRSRDPVVHYVLSWREGEHPSHAQVEEAMDLLTGEMQVTEHQALYGLHGDTDNVHLHAMVNRVHPETLAVVKINRGFDLEALHRAGARIEHAQGWRAERHARYRVNGQGEVERSPSADAPRAARPTQSQIDAELRTGEKSAARLAIETGGPLIEGARSWEALHGALGALGMRYAPTGSGATVQVGEVFVKASTVSRNATLARLEARLGPYEPAAPAPAPEAEQQRTPGSGQAGQCVGQAPGPPAHPSAARPLIEAARSWHGLHRALAEQGLRYVRKGSGALIIAGEHEAVTMKASAVARSATFTRLETRLGPYEAPGAQEGPHEKAMPRWADYVAERTRSHEERHAAWQAGEAEREAKERAVAKRQCEERDALSGRRASGEWRLVRELQRSLLAAEHASERAAFEARRRRAREAFMARHPPWPDYAAWANDPALARLWSERALAHPSLEPGTQVGEATQAQPAHDIRNYEGRAVGHWVLYATREQHERGQVAFVDRGRRITVHERDTVEAASRAALQLAAQKWGKVRVGGSQAHKERSARLAAELGITLVNPELQGLIRQYHRDAGRQADTTGARVRPSTEPRTKRAREGVAGAPQTPPPPREAPASPQRARIVRASVEHGQREKLPPQPPGPPAPDAPVSPGHGASTRPRQPEAAPQRLPAQDLATEVDAALELSPTPPAVAAAYDAEAETLWARWQELSTLRALQKLLQQNTPDGAALMPPRFVVPKISSLELSDQGKMVFEDSDEDGNKATESHPCTVGAAIRFEAAIEGKPSTEIPALEQTMLRNYRAEIRNRLAIKRQ